MQDATPAPETTGDAGPLKALATDLLLTQSRQTRAFRKSCELQRQTPLPVTHTPRKSAEIKYAAKLKNASWAQLGKWLKRSISRRMACQHAFVRVQGDSPKAHALRAALDIKAAQLDTARELIEAELTLRKHEPKVIDPAVKRRKALHNLVGK